MRRKIIFYWILCNGIYAVFGQEESDVLAQIYDQIEIIDSYTELETFYLDSEEFLDKMVDHGAELNGYYEHERLKKITRKIGTQVADIVTVFYFWNDQLIHVNYKQRPYLEKLNENGQRIMDYSKMYTKYESNHYFKNRKELKKKVVGKSLDRITPEKNFVKYAEKMKTLLDNKFYNKDMYDALQGKWRFIESEGDYILFEGTVRFNFYDGRFANRLKTRIEDGVMICFFPMDDRIYRYKIDSITDQELMLIDLSSKEEFRYTKVE
ncbi:hypothetical protein ABW636_13145 [Aquimarina sp. 2201CG1-2-11]|uniref:hypothetical protein n=1 Tax=Aquimarina discodermiae TaxID=3231043 RepID=UPI0034631CF6